MAISSKVKKIVAENCATRKITIFNTNGRLNMYIISVDDLDILVNPKDYPEYFI